MDTAYHHTYTYEYNDWHFYALSYRCAGAGRSVGRLVGRSVGRSVRWLGSAVVGEMNNFRTGTQLRARTSRVPSSQSTGHARIRVHTWQAVTDIPPDRSTIFVSFIFHCGQLFRAPAVPIGCPISSDFGPWILCSLPQVSLSFSLSLSLSHSLCASLVQL